MFLFLLLFAFTTFSSFVFFSACSAFLSFVLFCLSCVPAFAVCCFLFLLYTFRSFAACSVFLLFTFTVMLQPQVLRTCRAAVFLRVPL